MVAANLQSLHTWPTVIPLSSSVFQFYGGPICLLPSHKLVEATQVRIFRGDHRRKQCSPSTVREMNPSRLMLPAPPPSEDRAATIIQAHFRGFTVRRTRPLEHLHTIYQVRQDLKGHMVVLSDPAQYDKLCADPEQRLRWSECAMALLLRLDSVQGAHAHVRDIRKTVTREVIAFQEIVDSTSTGSAAIVKSRRKSVPFQSLFFALQQHGWVFTSSKRLSSHPR